MSSAKLSGLFVPNITPTNANGELDIEALQQYIDWLADHHMHGLYPNGSTGEFLSFTLAEHRKIVEVCVEQSRGRLKILAGAAEENVRQTIESCHQFADLGADAVAIVAPYYFKFSSEGVYQYYAAIAKEVRIDIALYNIPAFASPIDGATVERLASDFPRIIGIKDSSGDLPSMMRMMAAIKTQRPEFSFLTGWDASLAWMLIAGCDGGTNATSGVLPELTLAIYEAVKSGDFARAIDWQYDLLKLFDLMIATAEFPEGFRRGVKARGIDLGKSRQPLGPKLIENADHVERELKTLLGQLLERLSK